VRKIRVRLREILKEKGMTQMQLAEKTGIPQGTISRYYGDKIDRLDKNSLEKFCDALNVDLVDLLVLE
jgi:putative transcriptional regulator